MMPFIGCKTSAGDPGTPVEYTLPEGIQAKDAPVGRLKAIMNAGVTGVAWIDVRTDEEVAEGAIEGAIHIDFKKDDFQQKVLKLDKTKTYYVYCRSGRRSDKARNFMVRNGFSDVYNVTGGIIEWKNAGYPLVQEGAK